MNANQHQYLWANTETTGLVPSVCSLLEWAVALVRDDRDGDMSVVQQFSGCIHTTINPGPTPGSYWVKQPHVSGKGQLEVIPPNVIDMHTNSGLLAACLGETDDMATPLEAAEEFLIDLVGGPNTRDVILAGSSIQFDLGFFRAHMPRFAKCLHYRVLDVTSLYNAETTWGDAYDPPPPGGHRALPYILRSIAIARDLRARRWPRP
jgi:oligoribonuclease (3'-5' exoribonuclease)